MTQNDSFFFQHNSDLALLNTIFTADTFEDSHMYYLCNDIVEEMSFLTKPKTAESIFEVLPDHQYTLELFEVISVNVDNSLYEHLHLPEFKLYYPEPFIASPSFNHEELWFIHILHYQHWL